MKKRVWIGIPAGAGGEAEFGNYFRAVRAAGGEPCCPDTESRSFGSAMGGNAFASRAAPVRPEDCDALLLPGGGDLDPALYGQPNTASRNLEPDRDALERDLLDRFLRAGKPVLGVCRGMQSINVYFGGTLFQDIPNHGPVLESAGADGTGGAAESAAAGTRRRDRLHPVRTSPGPFADLFRAAGLLSGGTDTLSGGENLLMVNSSHHQAVDRPGDGLTVEQRAEDGVAEAVRHRTLPVWGVQWHPERLAGGAGGILFRAFLRLCQ